MKSPDASHSISIEPANKRVTVSFNGATLADSQRVLLLRESSYPAIFYIPREDVNMGLLKKSQHSSHCPYKGDASYWNVSAHGDSVANAVWSYENPHPTVAEIKNHMAFYPDKVDAIEVE